MGELFRRETAEHPEPFTGERLTTAIGGQVQIEHYHRYLFARSMIADADVIDVASGEGYGSALLAQVARSVIGIEYSSTTVRTATSNFPRPNLHFLQADARLLPLHDAVADFVVSFETIEHFDRQHQFVDEVRRVLRPGGSFIVSTPDRDVYSSTGAPVNPFHARELSRTEFIALLAARFRCVQILQQRPMIGSALLADTTSSAPPLVFDRRGDTHFEACAGLPRAPYLLAVASDREPKPLPPSVYIDRSDLDTDSIQFARSEAQLRQTGLALQEAQVALRQVRAELDAANQYASESKQQSQDWMRRAEHATRQAEQATMRAQEVELRAEQAELRVGETEMCLDTVRRDHAVLQGSMRTFLRAYLPRLRQHLFGQRP
jgi:SAM-dependent methyltransferase